MCTILTNLLFFFDWLSIFWFVSGFFAVCWSHFCLFCGDFTRPVAVPTYDSCACHHLHAEAGYRDIISCRELRERSCFFCFVFGFTQSESLVSECRFESCFYFVYLVLKLSWEDQIFPLDVAAKKQKNNWNVLTRFLSSSTPISHPFYPGMQIRPHNQTMKPVCTLLFVQLFLSFSLCFFFFVHADILKGLTFSTWHFLLGKWFSSSRRNTTNETFSSPTVINATCYIITTSFGNKRALFITLRLEDKTLTVTRCD